MRESEFQQRIIKDIEELLPGVFVLKNDPTYIQGFPDLIILWQDIWAALEVKRSSDSSFQPNQEFYINILDNMAFCRVIYPENRDKVLDELELYFLEGVRS